MPIYKILSRFGKTIIFAIENFGSWAIPYDPKSSWVYKLKGRTIHQGQKVHSRH